MEQIHVFRPIIAFWQMGSAHLIVVGETLAERQKLDSLCKLPIVKSLGFFSELLAIFLECVAR
jgi:hypothetical protein